MSYLSAVVARLGGPRTPAPLVRPVDALAAAGGGPLEADPVEEPAGRPTADQSPAAPGPRPPPPRPPVPPPTVRTPPSPHRPLTPPPIAESPQAAPGPVTERIEQREVERIQEVHHERETRHEVVAERRIEPAAQPATDRPRPAVQPLVREVRYPMAAAPPAPAARPGAPGQVLPAPPGPERASAEPAEPTVHVRIGRIVVRADPPAPPPTRTAPPAPPRLGLAAYLAGRESGSR